ncbi:unnamed protein product [Euphydryas editha]|uniref:Uncharacterized protein n=1 Tax=Euphydryas editha TaxID=104508 RepID=A0AAU9V0Z5_EUPED|nr:unnamed protein product [Euphydryas editha]
MNGNNLLRLPSNLEESESRTFLLSLRLITLMIVVVLLTLHIKSMRVFRWEHSVTGGLLVTYTIAALGLALCVGANRCGSRALQAYLTGMGAVFMSINAAVIWQRWTKAGELTLVVAELLSSLGIRLKRQVIAKVILSVAAAIALLIDLIATPILLPK